MELLERLERLDPEKSAVVERFAIWNRWNL